VQGRILAPLGMTHTAITMTPWMTRHLAKGHNTLGLTVPNWDVGMLAGAGGLRSTMTDMLTFAKANVSPGAGRLQRLMQATHTPRQATAQPGLSIGLNWHIRSADGLDVVWHNGGTGGYRTWIGFDPKRRIAAVVLTNSTHPPDDLGFQLVR
jgi:CubicO group peptidase (beta-lactamase class C family)